MEHLETRETVAGIVHDLDVSRITLTGIKTGPGTMSRVFSPLAEAGISVDVIVESAPKERRLGRGLHRPARATSPRH